MPNKQLKYSFGEDPDSPPPKLFVKPDEQAFKNLAAALMKDKTPLKDWIWYDENGKEMKVGQI